MVNTWQNLEPDELITLKRENKNPINTAASALSGALDFWLWLMNQTKTKMDNPEKYFWDEFFAKTFEDPETNGDRAVEELGTLLDGTYSEDGQAPFALLQIMGVIVDYSVQAMKTEKNGNHDLAWTYACDAQYWWGILNSEFARKRLPSALSVNAINAALARWEKDPKKIEKTFVNECWQEWRENLSKYKSKAAFARDMLTKCESLTSQKIIEDWCREWEKEI